MHKFGHTSVTHIAVWDVTWMSDQSMHLAKWMAALEQVTVRHLGKWVALCQVVALIVLVCLMWTKIHCTYFISMSLANMPSLHMWPALDAVSLCNFLYFRIEIIFCSAILTLNGFTTRHLIPSLLLHGACYHVNTNCTWQISIMEAIQSPQELSANHMFLCMWDIR